MRKWLFGGPSDNSSSGRVHESSGPRNTRHEVFKQTKGIANMLQTIFVYVESVVCSVSYM